MSRKLYALLLPVLAIAAMAMTAGAAQAAEPHWFICEKVGAGKGEFKDSECELAEAGGPWKWVEIPAGLANKRRVVTFGELTLTVTGGVSIKCQVLDRGFIWNLAGGGLDEINLFDNYECETIAGACPTPEITANGLPWKTTLLKGTPNKDKIEGESVTVFCNGVNSGTFTEPTGGPPLEPEVKESSAVFTTATGELEEHTAKVKAKVTGVDHFVTTAGQLVAAK